jgi:PRC-barrel domain
MVPPMYPVPGLYFALSVVLAAAPEPPPKAPVPRVVQQVPPELAEAILGRQVAGADGKDIGRLVDVLVDGDGVPQAAVIDFGGFLGVGNRRIAVRWDTLHFAPSDPDRAITIDMTPDEIKAAPAYTNPNKPAPVVTPEPASTPAAEAGNKPEAKAEPAGKAEPGKPEVKPEAANPEATGKPEPGKSDSAGSQPAPPPAGREAAGPPPSPAPR